MATLATEKGSPTLLEDLRPMEYWGYDSAGIATFDDRFITKKETGKIKELEQKLRFDQLEGTIGIGHTR